MQQCMQSVSNLQPRPIDFDANPPEQLGILPLGMAWFDALPLSPQIHSGALTVAVYPNQRLLQNHMWRLRRMGLSEMEFAAITADLPPHAERHLWNQIHEQQLPLLLLTARELQSVNTLGQLVNHTNVGSLVIEHAHLAIPGLWGPQQTPTYEALSQLLQSQWQGRPPVSVCSQAIPLQYQSMLISRFGLNQPKRLNTLPLITDLNFTVERYLTQHQKLNALRRFIQPTESGSSRITLVVCQSTADIHHLEKRLSPMPTLVFHHRLDNSTRLAHLTQLLQEPSSVVLVESAMLSELPTHLLPVTEIGIVHWQLPWSLESLIGQTLIAVPRHCTRLSGVLLYTREDYSVQKRRLSSQLQKAQTSTIHKDCLSRMRHFCIDSKICRRGELERALQDVGTEMPFCKTCDVCNDQGDSSLWRNILNLFLY